MKIEGSDVSAITPVNGVFHVAGIVRSPCDKVTIQWSVNGTDGQTICEAWEGQYQIETLCKDGYKIKSVALA